ncbi:MAG: DUF4345 domain-containing protein [Bacteroidota bacterium]
MNTIAIKLHLGISALVVIFAAIVYGGAPKTLLPIFFDFRLENLELKNIFRAIMGLYIAFACYWLWALKQPKYWKGATLSNILFMGGLALGRLLSLIIDGVSVQYTIGMLLEFFMMVWGIYNLKRLN